MVCRLCYMGPCMGIVKIALESPCPPRPTLPILHRPVTVPCSLLVSLFPCHTRDVAIGRLRPYFSLADLLTESTLSLLKSPPAPSSPQFLTAPPPWTAGPTASPLKTTAVRAREEAPSAYPCIEATPIIVLCSSRGGRWERTEEKLGAWV